VAEQAEWRMRRYDIVDKVIKGKLRILKEKNILIRVSFRTVETGIALLLCFSCFLPKSVPVQFSLLSIALLSLVIATWLFKKKWMGGALRLALYLVIPFVVYLSETDMVAWMSLRLELVYNLCFGVLIIFAVLTLKFTRRKKGFKITPMDFLILFIALVVPNLPEEHIRSYHMGLVAAKMIAFFFSYEVLIGELRGNLRKYALSTVVVLAFLVVRGIL
jgi:UDP-GlcNAc:undecaprenyl-phosphate GlcNAc-1-phosphate transferase